MRVAAMRGGMTFMVAMTVGGFEAESCDLQHKERTGFLLFCRKFDPLSQWGFAGYGALVFAWSCVVG